MLNYGVPGSVLDEEILPENVNHGEIGRYVSGESWADMISLAGVAAATHDAVGVSARHFCYIQCDNVLDQYMYHQFAAIGWDFDQISALSGKVDTASLKLYLNGKNDQLGAAPDFNLFEIPVDLGIITSANYAERLSTPLSDPIAFGDLVAPGYNTWAFNAAGKAALQAAIDAETNFLVCIRNSYDYNATQPPWESLKYIWIDYYTLNEGSGYQPCLAIAGGAEIPARYLNGTRPPG